MRGSSSTQPGATVDPPNDAGAAVECRVQQRLASCPYAFYFNDISWRFEKGQLTLNGRVPTFYLKQVLQTLLRDVEHVDQISNHVHVVSATGLSSEWQKPEEE